MPDLAAVRKWIGLKVRAERLAANRTQRDLGAAVGLSVTSIVNIEHGRHTTGLDKLLRIADAFGLCVREFIPSGADLAHPIARRAKLPPVSKPWRADDPRLTEVVRVLVYNPSLDTVASGEVYRDGAGYGLLFFESGRSAYVCDELGHGDAWPEGLLWTQTPEAPINSAHCEPETGVSPALSSF